MAEPRQLLSPSDAVTLAAHELAELGLANQTVRAITRAWGRFARFAEHGRGLTSIAAIDTTLVREFVVAPDPRGATPGSAAMHWRRSALRLLYRLWRSIELTVGDPTLDLALPPRSRRVVRPLTDDEIALCRWASLAAGGVTRLPAVWALAEAGATAGEIPRVLVAHVKLQSREVRLDGSSKTEPRVALLSGWGATQLARRIESLGGKRLAPVTYNGGGPAESGQASVSGAIGDILRRAGLADEPDVRPRSVTAWVGRKIFDETGRIELVARRLGLRSLDRAAALIGWDWRTG